MAPGPEALVSRRSGPERGDKKELLFTVARPTRPPEIRGDLGRQGRRGKPVPAGEYTICVEAAREHGTYQSIRKK